jgi:hypothetical protein
MVFDMCSNSGSAFESMRKSLQLPCLMAVITVETKMPHCALLMTLFNSPARLWRQVPFTKRSYSECPMESQSRQFIIYCEISSFVTSAILQQSSHFVRYSIVNEVLSHVSLSTLIRPISVILFSDTSQ